VDGDVTVETTTDVAKLELGGKDYELPIVTGSENERGIDISKLRSGSGHITLDEGYGNTGACQSSVCFIDGERGVLRYRGIPIEQLASNSRFIETAMLVIYGELPTADHLDRFRALLTKHELLHEGLHNHFDGFPAQAHPMAILSAMINACSCYHLDIMEMEDEQTFESAAARLLSKVRTIAAAAYKTSIGEPTIYPKPSHNYGANFLHMMFSKPYSDYEPPEEVVKALNLFLILHSEHEQNCSTSTVRMVASSGANLFASCSAGVCALWGWRHGGANIAVIQMLEEIHNQKIPYKEFMERVKKKQMKLMGFGHRVYKNFDPRATILKESCDDMLRVLGVDDPLLDLARGLEEVALNDSYFKDRNLYPNVDFYSGILLRAMGIPVDMFTVMFAMGRMPGWIAHWKEVHDNPETRISRPRQVYTGDTERDYTPIENR